MPMTSSPSMIELQHEQKLKWAAYHEVACEPELGGIKAAVEPCLPCAPCRDVSVLLRICHHRLCWAPRRGGTRSGHRRREHLGYLCLWTPVWHGQRTEHADREGRRCQAAGQAGHLHAAVVDPLWCHHTGACTGVRLRHADPTVVPPPASRCVARRRAVRQVGDPEIVRARHGHPAPHVLPSPEQGLDFGGHLRRGPRRARHAHIHRREAARVRPARGGCCWRHLTVAYCRGAIHVLDRRPLPRHMEGVHYACVQQHRRFHQAVAWIGRHDLFGVLVQHITSNSRGSPQTCQTSTRYHVCLPQLRVHGNTGCTGIQIQHSSWVCKNRSNCIRVSNELGAKRPMETKFAVLVAVSTSIFMGPIFMGVVLIWRTSLPKLFSDSEEVIHGSSKLGLLLALTVCMISICPVLSGIAVGAGWQVSVAFINIGCFYLVGIPMGILFGIKLKHGTMGIWMGMLIGTFLQMAILLTIILTTNWDKQAALTEVRMAEWGGKENLPLMKSPHTDDQMTPAQEKMLAQPQDSKNVDLLRTE